MATPSLSPGVHAAASASGVNPSAPSTSMDQMSVYPSSTRSSNHRRCWWSGTSKGTVIPWRRWSVLVTADNSCTDPTALAGVQPRGSVTVRAGSTSRWPPHHYDNRNVTELEQFLGPAVRFGANAWIDGTVPAGAPPPDRGGGHGSAGEPPGSQERGATTAGGAPCRRAVALGHGVGPEPPTLGGGRPRHRGGAGPGRHGGAGGRGARRGPWLAAPARRRRRRWLN